MAAGAVPHRIADDLAHRLLIQEWSYWRNQWIWKN